MFNTKDRASYFHLALTLTAIQPCSEFKKRQKMLLKQKEQAEKKVRLLCLNMYEDITIATANNHPFCG